MKCYSFSQCLLDPSDVAGIIIANVRFHDHVYFLNEHVYIFMYHFFLIIWNWPIKRSSGVIWVSNPFFVNKFQPNIDRDTKWMPMCLSHQGILNDIWNDLLRPKVTLTLTWDQIPNWSFENWDNQACCLIHLDEKNIIAHMSVLYTQMVKS